jgi:hypothetical protein
MEFLKWLEHTEIGEWVRTDTFGFPLILCAHSIGLAGVVGIVYMLSFRVLGYSKGIPITVFERIFYIGWAAFILNAISGVLLFMSNATHLIVNWTFLLKLILIAAGGVSLWALWNALMGGPERRTPQGVVTPRGKALAMLCLVFWTGAIVSGRYIAFTMAEAKEKELMGLTGASPKAPAAAKSGVPQ